MTTPKALAELLKVFVGITALHLQLDNSGSNGVVALYYSGQ